MAKPRLLFIHGWLHSCDRYRPLARALADSYEVILQPLAGYDRGQVPKGGGYLDAYAGQVVDRIRRQRPQVVVGFSMGGQILLRALAGASVILPWAVFSNTPYPALAPFQGLARLGWAVYWGLRTLQKWPRALAKPIIDGLSALTVRHPRSIDGLFYQDACRVQPAVAAGCARDLALGMDRVRPLKGIAGLVTRSGHDRLVPPDQARLLARDLQVPLVNFPAAGHTVVVDAFEDYLALLRLLARRL